MPELWLLAIAAAGVGAALYGHSDVGLNHLVAAWRQGRPVSASVGELGEAQLREEVERAWAEVSCLVDRIIGSGRMLDRDVLMDLARFLESAMPAVAAYERLVARAYEEAVAAAGLAALPLRRASDERASQELPTSSPGAGLIRGRSRARAGGGPDILEHRRALSATTATRAAHVGLWTLVGLTFFAAAVALLRPPPRAGATVKVPESTVGAQGFAELYVAAYLGAGKGTEQSLRPFYPQGVDFADVSPGGVYAGRTTAIEAREVQRRYWAVTVGAELLFPQSGGLVSGGVRFYQVGVVRVADAYVATSLPAEVPAPAVGRAPKLAMPSMDRPGRDDPVAAAVARFASAFLGGEGELARYTAPGSALRSVRPAPFHSVEVTGLSSRTVEREVNGTPSQAKEVVAEVQGTDASGRTQVLHYALELVQRAGRWEVAKLLGGPPLAAEQPSASPRPEPAVTASSAPVSPTTSVLGAAGTTTTTTASGRTAAPAERTTTTR